MDKVIFISYLDPKFVSRHNEAISLDNQYLLRILNEKSCQGNEIFKGWALSKGSSIVQLGEGVGVIEMFPSYMEELAQKWREYDLLVDTCLCIGVGKTLQESEKALDTIKHNQNGGIVFYSDAILHEEENKEHPKTIEEVIDQDLMHKAEEESSPANIEELASNLHGHAQKHQHNKENIDGIKSKIVESLTLLKENMPIIKEIQNQSPDLYQAVLNLSKIVVKLANTLENKDLTSLGEFSGKPKEQTSPKDIKPSSNKEGKVKVYHPKTHRMSWRKIGSISKEKNPTNTVVVG